MGAIVVEINTAEYKQGDHDTVWDLKNRRNKRAKPKALDNEGTKVANSLAGRHERGHDVIT